MNSQDFDRLSAYLDHQLSGPERAALEARLGQEADLRAGLDELRRNVRLLRALPQHKVPRNFTLTPEQARAVRRPRFSFNLFPAMRLATGFAALAFVFVLGADLWQTNNAAMLAQAPAPAAVQMEAASESAVEGGVESFAALEPGATLTVEVGVAQALPDSADLQRTGKEAPDAQPAEGAEGLAVGSSEAEAPEPAAPLRAWTIGLGVITAALAAATWLFRRR